MTRIEDALRNLIQYHSKRVATNAFGDLPAHVRAARKDIRALQRTVRALAGDVAALLAARERERPVPPAPDAELANVRFTKRTPKSLRERFDLTQEELAKLLQVSPITITSWESGKSRPRKANLAQIVTLRTLEQAQVDAGLGRVAAPAAVKPAQMKRLRRKLSLTQSELARLVGVSVASVTSWEAGKAAPGRESRHALADLRKLSRKDVDQRLGRTSPAPGGGAAGAAGRLSPAEIRSIRGRAGLSQRGLARVLKVSVNSVSNWETGRTLPRRATVEKLLGLAKKA
jgi:DNA-binding transcriptional regulator YiaG